MNQLRTNSNWIKLCNNYNWRMRVWRLL